MALFSATLAALSGCDPTPSTPPTPTAQAAPAEAPAPVHSGPQPGVKPVEESHKASSVGPSDGAAAIGGLAGPGGATGGQAPAPTAGDGAASAASR